jgi:hypothetical protein
MGRGTVPTNWFCGERRNTPSRLLSKQNGKNSIHVFIFDLQFVYLTSFTCTLQKTKIGELQSNSIYHSIDESNMVCTVHRSRIYKI